MPNLNIPISRVPPSGRAATKPPPYRYERGMLAAARGEERARATLGVGLQQLGAGMDILGEKLHNQLVGDQYLKARIEYTTETQKFFAEMENKEWAPNGIPQWQQAQEQFDAHQKKTIEAISNELVPDAKDLFQSYALLKKLSGDEVLDRKRGIIRNNYLLETLPLEIGRIAQSGDWEEAYGLLNEFKALILATGAIPESQLLQFDKIFDTAVVTGAIGNRLSGEQIEQLIKEADSLTPSEKASLRRSAKAAIASRQREQQAALDAKQDETSSKMLLKLLNNDLTYDEVKIALDKNWLDETKAKSLWSSLLDPTVPKTDYLKALENVNKAISDFRENRKTKKEAMDVLYDNQRNIGRNELGQLLNEIEEMSIPDSALNRSSVKRAISLIEEHKGFRIELMKKRAAGDEEFAETLAQDLKQELFLAFGHKNEFIKWILENPKVSDKEIEDTLRFLLEPAKEETAGIALNWFERLILAKEKTPFLGKYTGTTEEEKLIKKKIKALKKEGVWDTLSEEEKAGIEQGRARTVEEVVKERGSVKLQSAPLVEFDKIWPSLTDKQKVNVWKALDNGYTPQEILDALEKK